MTSVAGEMEMEISALPLDALLRIFSFLDVPQMLQVRRVCRLWRDLALHPDLWKTRKIECNVERSGSVEFLEAVLRLAPCVGELAVYCEINLKDVDDFGLPLSSTACAAEHLDLTLKLQQGTPFVVGLIIRNQLTLGRLKKVSVKLHSPWPSHELTDFHSAGVFQLLTFLCSIEGLEHLKFYSLGSPREVKPPLCASRLSSREVAASLRSLDVMTSYAGNSHLEYLIKCHASTLVSVNGNVPVGVIVTAAGLQTVDILLQEDITPLLQCQHLTTFAVHLCDGDEDENVPALDNARAFLRGAARRLKEVTLSYGPERKRPEELNLVKSLAEPGDAAVERLTFSFNDTWEPSPPSWRPRYLRPLATALPRLPNLRELILDSTVTDEFLRAVSPSSAPCLVRLKVRAPDDGCLHGWLHRREVGDMLRRNPRLHCLVHTMEGGCGNCGSCRKACHPDLVRDSGAAAVVRVCLVGHAESGGCGLVHRQCSDVCVQI